MSKIDQSNKSLTTNVLAAACLGTGYLLPEPYRSPVTNMGLFALSGAVTNWIAIHMLFERVPGLYGSGIIPLHFKEFKHAIHDMMMHQFFTHENVNRLFESESGDGNGPSIDFAPIIDDTDFTPAFEALIESVEESPLGGMLSMVGGPNALEPLRDPFQQKIGTAIKQIAASDSFQQTLQENLKTGSATEEVLERVSAIVAKRLDELTPQMVKEIIQKMIREHLGWLVVWGGVFGGIIGLIVTLLPN